VTRDLYLINSGQTPIIVRGIGKDDPNGAVIQGDMLDSIVGRQLPPPASPPLSAPIRPRFRPAAGRVTARGAGDGGCSRGNRLTKRRVMVRLDQRGALPGAESPGLDGLGGWTSK
jgi:hypothetical protein